MKFISSLCILLAIGAVCGDGVSPTETSESETCPLKADKRGRLPNGLVLGHKLNQCLLDADGTDFRLSLRNASSHEESKALMKTHCADRATIVGCADETSTQSRLCLNESQHSVFKIHREVFDLVLEAGCSDGGSRTANLYRALFENQNSTRRDFIFDCWNSIRDQVEPLENVEDALVRVHLYKNFKILKSCLSEFGQANVNIQSYVDDGANIFADVLAKMKCFNKENTSLILCETAVTD